MKPFLVALSVIFCGWMVNVSYAAPKEETLTFVDFGYNSFCAYDGYFGKLRVIKESY